MKIGILGGSFDPPHIAHALICRETREVLRLDEVWIMPCYGHTFNKKLSPAHHRFTMTKMLEEPGVSVSDFEIHTRSAGYTIQTLRALRSQRPNDQFFWIIGSDQLEKFHTWGPGWRDIFTVFNLVVFPRETAVIDLRAKTRRCLRIKRFTPTIHVLDDPDLTLSNISSTMIRKRVKEYKSIRHLVSPAVENYIQKNNLYR